MPKCYELLHVWMHRQGFFVGREGRVKPARWIISGTVRVRLPLGEYGTAVFC
jgi:hypothetical protein